MSKSVVLYKSLVLLVNLDLIVSVRGTDVRAEQFFGFMKFKYKKLTTRSSIQLKNLQMFN